MGKPNESQARAIIASQYALYFGVLGVFLPYFNLYCYHLGFNGVQIGILSSLRSVVLVLFSLAWGAVADRFRIRKPLYVLCNLMSALIWTFYFFSDAFWIMLLITACYGVFYAPIIAFMEAFSMDHLGVEKRAYGSIRAWGSVSFIIVTIFVGWLLDRANIRIILVFILAGGVMQTLVSIWTPVSIPKRQPRIVSNFQIFLHKKALVFLFCGFLMLVSHGAYYGFFSIYLEELGFGSSFIGFAWALASIAEILVMINSKKLFKNLSLKRALMFSFVVATLRWVLLGTVRSGYALLLLQVLHAATYGMFHMASILYIDRLSPEGAKTLGQSINNAVTYGLGLMTGFFISGFLYERAGASFCFLVSALIALCAGAIFTGFAYWNRRQLNDTI